jgi:hypothetical protein
MYQRLEAKKPHYNHLQWVRDRLQNLIYLQNISAYPERFAAQRKEYETMKRELEEKERLEKKKKESQTLVLPKIGEDKDESHPAASIS